MDRGVAKAIAALCCDGPGTRVVEIGAGTGTLTEALLGCGAQVTAIEIDTALVALLRTRPELAGAEIVGADALDFDYKRFSEPWRAAGNLPYNIATPLILQWLALATPPCTIVAMVQRDVADRLTARPSTRAYGSLTVAVGYAMQVRRAMTLGPSVFYPKPKVDSSVIVMQRRERPAVQVNDVEFFMQVVRAAFAYRRKTLANSLSLALGLSRSSIQAAMARLGLASEIRGEQLDLDAFAALANNLGA